MDFFNILFPSQAHVENSSLLLDERERKKLSRDAKMYLTLYSHKS